MYSTNSVRMSRSGGMVGDLADAYRPKRMRATLSVFKSKKHTTSPGVFDHRRPFGLCLFL